MMQSGATDVHATVDIQSAATKLCTDSSKAYSVVAEQLQTIQEKLPTFLHTHTHSQL